MCVIDNTFQFMCYRAPVLIP